MKPNKIRAVWREYDQYIAKKNTSVTAQDFNKRLADFFCPGEFYYYIFDFVSMSFTFMSDSYQSIIGLDPKEITIDRFLARTHPDDVDYFSRCESIAAQFLFEHLHPEEIFNYKVNYCFRLKTANDSYQLFLHQSTGISLDDNGRLGSVFGVHSNISHLTDTNNHKISFIGLNGAPSFRNINVFGQEEVKFNTIPIDLTPRELEILRLIADGNTAREIAELLFIAEPTVRKHRENLLKKTNSKNTAHLINNSIRNGLI